MEQDCSLHIIVTRAMLPLSLRILISILSSLSLLLFIRSSSTKMRGQHLNLSADRALSFLETFLCFRIVLRWQVEQNGFPPRADEIHHVRVMLSQSQFQCFLPWILLPEVQNKE